MGLHKTAFQITLNARRHRRHYPNTVRQDRIRFKPIFMELAEQSPTARTITVLASRRLRSTDKSRCVDVESAPPFVLRLRLDGLRAIIGRFRCSRRPRCTSRLPGRAPRL
jgi:hypothetical protein